VQQLDSQKTNEKSGVFDLMDQKYAPSNINIIYISQKFVNPYAICPNGGGIASKLVKLELFLEFLDNLYEIFSIEIHNPLVCNVNHMKMYFVDVFGNRVDDVTYNSLSVNGVTFIETGHRKKSLKFVRGIYLALDGTNDAKTPNKCEIRLFAKTRS
jgi:hypothetical protein